MEVSVENQSKPVYGPPLPPNHRPPPKTFFEKLQELYVRHEKIAPAVFFIFGVLFDIFTLGRVDSMSTIAKQAVFLIVIGSLISLEFLQRIGRFIPGPKLKKIWVYHEASVHFLLGSLLSLYTIFYFKSASLFTSSVFLGILVLLLVANEFHQIRNLGVGLRIALFSLCQGSYFVFVVPILMGKIGNGPFLIAIGTSLLVLFGLFWTLKKRSRRKPLIRQIVFPSLLMHALLFFLYFAHFLPPVPLAVHYMGIYHKIEKVDGKYQLSYARPQWKFWQHGDQDFHYTPGQPLYGFASIFSPTGYEGTINVRWLKKENKKWITQDIIALKIVGGRTEGYRGYTVKEHYSDGDWRFQVETPDGREIGRLYFTISRTESLPELKTEFR